MDMSMRKQMTQQMAATTSRRTEPKADLGGNMSMIPVIKLSTPTNWKREEGENSDHEREAERASHKGEASKSEHESDTDMCRCCANTVALYNLSYKNVQYQQA